VHNSCRRCGKETEEGGLYCPQCADALASGAVKPKRVWLFALCFSFLLLLLAGLILWPMNNCCNIDLSWDGLTGKPAAMINGETVTRQEFRTRFNITQRMLERQYGPDIFGGEAGANRLASVKQEVLDRMLEERLIAQEARRLGITISEEMVDRELRRIGRELSGAGENFKKQLAADGIDEDALQNHLRYVLTYQALGKTLLGRADRSAPEANFAAWFARTKKSARINIYDASLKTVNVAAAGGGCCGLTGGASGGCGGGRAPAPVDGATEKLAGEAALAAYCGKNGRRDGLKTRVTDYGCHIQVDIVEGGKTVRSYTYKDGAVYEI